MYIQQPVSPLAHRFYAYLEKWEEACPAVPLERDVLIAIGERAGEVVPKILCSLRELESVVNVASFWRDGTMWYGFVWMSTEEKKRRVDDLAWFDTL